MVIVKLGVALEVACIALAERISFFDDEHVLLTILAVYFKPFRNQICRYRYFFLLLVYYLHQTLCEQFFNPITITPKSFDVLTLYELVYIDSLHISLYSFDLRLTSANCTGEKVRNFTKEATKRIFKAR